MRDIEFRAISTPDRDWVEFTLAELAFAQPDFLEGVDITDTLCQATGLTDRNGIPVWENDVVVLPQDRKPYLVKWLEGSAGFALCRDEEDFVGIHCEVSAGEVIGNVFENPDLLGHVHDWVPQTTGEEEEIEACKCGATRTV